jgi:hypothetical protein
LAHRTRDIETVSKRGYRFIADVTDRPREADPRPSPMEGTGRGAPAAGETTTSRPSGPSLAVLPFTGLGRTAMDEYLTLGMADAVITRLSNTSSRD